MIDPVHSRRKPILRTVLVIALTTFIMETYRCTELQKIPGSELEDQQDTAYPSSTDGKPDYIWLPVSMILVMLHIHQLTCSSRLCNTNVGVRVYLQPYWIIHSIHPSFYAFLPLSYFIAFQCHSNPLHEYQKQLQHDLHTKPYHAALSVHRARTCLIGTPKSALSHTNALDTLTPI